MTLDFKRDLLPGIVAILQAPHAAPEFEVSALHAAAAIHSQFYTLAEDAPRSLYPTSRDWTLTVSLSQVRHNSGTLRWMVIPHSPTETRPYPEVTVEVTDRETGTLVTYKRLTGQQELEVKDLRSNSTNHVTIKLVEEFTVNGEDWNLVHDQQTRVVSVKRERVKTETERGSQDAAETGSQDQRQKAEVGTRAVKDIFTDVSNLTCPMEAKEGSTEIVSMSKQAAGLKNQSGFQVDQAAGQQKYQTGKNLQTSATHTAADHIALDHTELPHSITTGQGHKAVPTKHKLLANIVRILQAPEQSSLSNQTEEDAAAILQSQCYKIAADQPKTLQSTDKQWGVSFRFSEVAHNSCKIRWLVTSQKSAATCSEARVMVDVTNIKTKTVVTYKILTAKQELEITNLRSNSTNHVTVKLVEEFTVNGEDWNLVYDQQTRVVSVKQKRAETETGKGSQDGDQMAETGRGSRDAELTAETGRGSWDAELTAETGRGSQDGDQMAETGRGSQDGDQMAETGRGSQDGDLTAETGRGSRDAELTAETGRGSQDGDQMAETGRGSQDGDQMAERGRGSQDAELKAETRRGSQDTSELATQKCTKSKQSGQKAETDQVSKERHIAITSDTFRSVIPEMELKYKEAETISELAKGEKRQNSFQSEYVGKKHQTNTTDAREESGESVAKSTSVTDRAGSSGSQADQLVSMQHGNTITQPNTGTNKVLQRTDEPNSTKITQLNKDIVRQDQLAAIVRLLQATENCSSASNQATECGTDTLHPHLYRIADDLPRTLYSTSNSWRVSVTFPVVTENSCRIKWQVQPPTKDETKPTAKVRVEVRDETGEVVTYDNLRWKQELEIQDLKYNSCNHVTVRLAEHFEVDGEEWSLILHKQKRVVYVKTKKGAMQTGDTGKKKGQKAEELGIQAEGIITSDSTWLKEENIIQSMKVKGQDLTGTSKLATEGGWQAGVQTEHVAGPEHQNSTNHSPPPETSKAEALHSADNNTADSKAVPLTHQLLPDVVRILQAAKDPILSNQTTVQEAVAKYSKSFRIAGDLPRTLYPQTNDWRMTVSFPEVTENSCKIRWQIKKPAQTTSALHMKVKVTSNETGQIVTYEQPAAKQEIEIQGLGYNSCNYVTLRLVQEFHVDGEQWNVILDQQKRVVYVKKKKGAKETDNTKGQKGATNTDDTKGEKGETRTDDTKGQKGETKTDATKGQKGATRTDDTKGQKGETKTDDTKGQKGETKTDATKGEKGETKTDATKGQKEAKETDATKGEKGATKTDDTKGEKGEIKTDATKGQKGATQTGGMFQEKDRASVTSDLLMNDTCHPSNTNQSTKDTKTSTDYADLPSHDANTTPASTAVPSKQNLLPLIVQLLHPDKYSTAAHQTEEVRAAIHHSQLYKTADDLPRSLYPVEKQWTISFHFSEVTQNGCTINWVVVPPKSTEITAEPKVQVDVTNVETGKTVSYRKLSGKEDLQIKALKFNSTNHVTIRLVEQFSVNGEQWNLMHDKQTKVLTLKQKKVDVKTQKTETVTMPKKTMSQNKPTDSLTDKGVLKKDQSSSQPTRGSNTIPQHRHLPTSAANSTLANKDVSLRQNVLAAIVQILLSDASLSSNQIEEPSEAAFQSQFYKIAEDVPTTLYTTAKDWRVSLSFSEVTENSCRIKWQTTSTVSPGEKLKLKVMVDVRNTDTGQVVKYTVPTGKQELVIKALKAHSTNHVVVKLVEEFEVEGKKWQLLLAKCKGAVLLRGSKAAKSKSTSKKASNVKTNEPKTISKVKDGETKELMKGTVKKDFVNEISKLRQPGQQYDMRDSWSVTFSVTSITCEGFQVRWDIQAPPHKVEEVYVEIKVIAVGSDVISTYKLMSETTRRCTIEELAPDTVYRLSVVVMKRVVYDRQDTFNILTQCSHTVTTLPGPAHSHTVTTLPRPGETECKQLSSKFNSLMDLELSPVSAYSKLKQGLGLKSSREVDADYSTESQPAGLQYTEPLHEVHPFVNTGASSAHSIEEASFFANEVHRQTHMFPQDLACGYQGEDYNYLELSSDDRSSDASDDDTVSHISWSETRLPSLSSQLPTSVLNALPFDHEENYSYLQASEDSLSEDTQSCCSDMSCGQQAGTVAGDSVNPRRAGKHQKMLAHLLRQQKDISIVEDTAKAKVLQDNSNEVTITSTLSKVTHKGFQVNWTVSCRAKTKLKKKKRIVVEVQDIKSKEVYTYLPQTPDSIKLTANKLSAGRCYHVEVRMMKDMVLDCQHWTCILARAPQLSVTLRTQAKPKPATTTGGGNNKAPSQSQGNIPTLLSFNPFKEPELGRDLSLYNTAGCSEGEGLLPTPEPAGHSPDLNLYNTPGCSQRSGLLPTTQPGRHNLGYYNTHGNQQKRPKPGSHLYSHSGMDADGYSHGYEDMNGLRAASPVYQPDVNSVLLQELHQRLEALSQKFPDRSSLLRYFGYSRDRQSNIRTFTTQQLQQLERKARGYQLKSRQPMEMISCLYRNKPAKHFWNILKNCGGRMIPYEKDYNGDPCCPINGKIDGLFFNGKLDNRGNLPMRSPFGDTRFIVPVQRLFHPHTNLYFTDFYCTNRDRNPHYVTVVITLPGSKTDAFCQQRLLPLDKYNNPYLCLDTRGRVLIARPIYVEVFYTETLDLVEEMHYGATWQSSVETMGRGCSSDKGIPKNPTCKVCNL